MLAISVELLQGTYRADPDGTANTGSLTLAAILRSTSP